MSEFPHIEPGSWVDVRHVRDVGRFVAAVRKGAGLTQAELAARTGLPRRFVNELETGHSTRFLDRLSVVLQELGIRVVLETARTHEVTGHGDIRVAGGVNQLAVPSVKDFGW